MRDVGKTREEFVNHDRQVVYEFFECSTNIPSGLSAYNALETGGLLLLYEARVLIWLLHK